MPKLPVLSGRELIRILVKQGWEQSRIHGSHAILIRVQNGKKTAVVVPLHREIDRGTLLEILRQAGLTREQLLGVL